MPCFQKDVSDPFADLSKKYNNGFKPNLQKRRRKEGREGWMTGWRKKGRLDQHSFAENQAHLETVFHLLARILVVKFMLKMNM